MNVLLLQLIVISNIFKYESFLKSNNNYDLKICLYIFILIKAVHSGYALTKSPALTQNTLIVLAKPTFCLEQLICKTKSP